MKKWEFDFNRLRLARESRDMTQDQLAETIGVTKQQISSWEMGAVYPGQESMMKIVNALGIAPKFFYVLSAKNGDVETVRAA